MNEHAGDVWNTVEVDGIAGDAIDVASTKSSLIIGPFMPSDEAVTTEVGEGFSVVGDDAFDGSGFGISVKGRELFAEVISAPALESGD